jgi:hypothetical protein
MLPSMIRAFVLSSLFLAPCSSPLAAHDGATGGTAGTSGSGDTSASGQGGSIASDAASIEPVYCEALQPCCSYSDFVAEPPPDCTQVAASGDNLLCGLSLQAIQAVYGGLNGLATDGIAECGPQDMNTYPPTTDPACLALKACSATINDPNDSATCTLVATINFGKPCRSALAYFESRGYCARVAFDAGAWSGLPPPATNYNSGSGASGGGESSSDGSRGSP